ncbi:hypothetical protein GTA08_BOTSDO01624 [Botryosphaeria dothidea]|uniref:Tubulin gamma chain protein n=1 Tax=Botryosphaeria dothidea TaxID=55169 RepID=A0A8H4J701_9PEZI|nr:hypothetical protein GTA08_BOTSDO01624 [Botryosphaeria dothidea]
MTIANNVPVTGVDSANPKTVEERKAELPLPDQPPTSSDWQSADARNVNVSSGGVSGDISHGNGSEALREPATNDQSINVGRTAKDGLSGLPNDAVTGDKRGHSNTAETRK